MECTYTLVTCSTFIHILDAGHAFWGSDRIAGLISAVVVDQVVHSNPLVPSRLVSVELLVCRALPPIVRVGRAVRRPGSHATLEIEVLVVGIEWCPAPIDLL